MALDSLQRVIEKLQKTIEAHRGYLAGDETRTRQVLIDPLLRKLGWDVSDPNIVQLEYRVQKEQADYVLISKGKPIAVVEAKRLGSDLGDKPIMQALKYAIWDSIDYIIVTDGDKWEMYEVFKKVTFKERLLVRLELSQQSAHKNAKQALAMRKPNLTAKKPVFKPPKSALDKPLGRLPSGGSSKDSDTWCSFEDKIYPPDTDPAKLKIGNSPAVTVKSWTEAIHKVVAWLADEDILSVNDCPIGTATYTFIGPKAVNPDGTPFKNSQELSNGLILQGGYVNTQAQWRKLRQLLGDLGENRSAIRVSYESSRQPNR